MSEKESRGRAIVIPFKSLTITSNINGKGTASHIIIDGKEYGDDCDKISFSHDARTDEVHLELDTTVGFIPDRRNQ